MNFGYKLLENPNIPTLKPTEMDLLYYLVFNQDNSTGEVLGVKYKDVSEATGMVKQSFYNSLYSLQKKNIITYQRHEDGAFYTVKILDNDFPDNISRSKGYINLKRTVFHSKEFKELKPQEKYLVLYFYKRTHENQGSFCIYVQNLYKNLTLLLGVTDRVVRSYLHSLRQFFSIGIVRGKYYITYKHNIFKEKLEQPERLFKDKRIICEMAHKLKIRNTNDYEISQTAEFLYQYKQMAAKAKKDLKKIIFEAIKDTVSGILQKDRKLSYKLINILIKERLDKDLKKSQNQISHDREMELIKQLERSSLSKAKKIVKEEKFA